MIVKRAIDIVVAGLALLALLPLMAVLAVIVKLDSRGPVIYRGKRMGQGGGTFDILKFRTMVAGAERLGPAITYGRDDRVTRVGRFLRRSKLDELPQLVNVLAGNMSLVGPRPEDPRYREIYESGYSEVLTVAPGLTGLAMVELDLFREEDDDPGEDWERYYVKKALPRKLDVDLRYVRSRSATLDLRIMARTFGTFLGITRAGPSAGQPKRSGGGFSRPQGRPEGSPGTRDTREGEGNA